MKKLLLLGLTLAIAGCGPVKKEEAKIQTHDAAMEAATQKIIVTRSTSVDGHPKVTDLGPVEGRCANDPTGQETFPEDNLREAAYRKYGDQVNAIVNTSVWFVSDDDYGAYEPYTEGGYFECAGTAVHFTGEPAPAASPAQSPPS